VFPTVRVFAAAQGRRKHSDPASGVGLVRERRVAGPPTRDESAAGLAQWGIVVEYTIELRNRIAANLTAHRRRTHDLGERRHAAVALVVVDSTAGGDADDPAAWSADSMRDVPGGEGLDGRVTDVAGGAAFLLCRRAAGLNRHASQWALPGGRLDAGETPINAARRELHEELGVDLPPHSVLGLLDDYPSRSGYVITPVVLWAGGHLELQPDPGEVLAAYRIGIHHLQRDDSPRFVDIPESDRPVVQVPIGNDLIHAPTGAVLVQFRWLALEGRHDPVDEFEQPVFAWR